VDFTLLELAWVVSSGLQFIHPSISMESRGDKEGEVHTLNSSRDKRGDSAGAHDTDSWFADVVNMFKGNYELFL
jgi:hypothetical protein